MAILSCPTCGKNLKIPDNLLGKKVKCSACAAVFTAELPAEQPRRRSEAEERPKRRDPDSRVSDEDDDRPRRRSRRDRDNDSDDRPRRRGRPHRGGLIMGLGIAALALTLFAAVITGLFHVFGIPLVIAGLALGIVSWVMGNGDMRAIRSGRMDSAGEGMTSGGRIMGMIAVILNVLGICLCGGLFLVGLIFGLAFLGMAAGNARGGNPQPPPFPIRPGR